MRDGRTVIWDGGAKLSEGRVEFCDSAVFWEGLREPEEGLRFVGSVLRTPVVNARMAGKEKVVQSCARQNLGSRRA